MKWPAGVKWLLNKLWQISTHPTRDVSYSVNVNVKLTCHKSHQTEHHHKENSPMFWWAHQKPSVQLSFECSDWVLQFGIIWPLFDKINAMYKKSNGNFKLSSGMEICGFTQLMCNMPLAKQFHSIVNCSCWLSWMLMLELFSHSKHISQNPESERILPKGVLHWQQNF